MKKINKNKKLNEWRKPIKKAVKLMASEERIANAIYGKLLPTLVDIIEGKPSKKKVFIPFIVEFDVGKESCILRIGRTLPNGRDASEWLKNKIIGKR